MHELGSRTNCIFMDLDGSTLTDDGELPSDLRELIGASRQVHWIIVTGRAYASASKTAIASVVCRQTPHVFDGGATIMDLSGRLHQRTCLSHDELEAFFECIDATQCEYIYAGINAGGGYCWFASRDSHRALPTLRCTSEIAEYRSWLKGAEISKLSIRQRRDCKVTLRIHHVLNDNNIDVTAAGVDKAFGARAVLRMLGAQPERTAFIFNDKNDLALVQDPYFVNMATIKVGDLLPNVEAHISVATPHDVSRALRPLLAK